MMPGPHDPQSRFEKQTVVCGRSAGITRHTWQNQRDPLLLLFAQQHLV
jgi:hypothetical protein